MVDQIELDRRGLRYFVVVDADITQADRAALEQQGLIYKVQVDESGNSVAPGGGVAPALSSANAVDFSDIFVWGQATTDTASGTLYAVVVPGVAATPSAAQIVAGTDAAGAAAPNANIAITSTGVKNVLVRGLTAATSYKVCMAHQLAGANSNVVTSSFTTDTLVLAFATNGLATGMAASTGCGALGLNQADPHGGTNAIRFQDNNDAATNNAVLCTCTVAAFFNGVNKFHVTVKHVGGAAHLRVQTGNVTIVGHCYFNTSTGVVGNELWAGTPVTFNVGSGWWMLSGSLDMTGADLNGILNLHKAMVDNNVSTITRNGTHIQDIYNIRITRV